MAKSIAEATTKIYEQLERLAPQERRRAVDAALTMLGEPATDSRSFKTVIQEQESTPVDGFSEMGMAWIKKNNLGVSALVEMFHTDNGKVQLILASPIGKSKREQTLNTYLLTGVAAFLETGTAEFTDDVARKNCQHLGCYDSANHAVYVKKDFGNKITGSKGSGWRLTAPGLTAAAKLIRPSPETDA